ncbi:MAG: outer membrane beta-barrel protein [Alphaproteobacteria bacterium]|nr:outer membrane beta-barrel protein [Alphaproteobacteria bacterium]
MKKYLYACAISLSMLATAVSADFYAGLGYGVGLNGGSAYSNGHIGSFENSSVYSLSGGYVLPLPWFDVRGEVEYLHTRPDIKGQGARQLDAVMGSVSAVIPFIPVVDPYVGLGLGYGKFDHKFTSAWQYQMGMEYQFVTAPFAVGAEYRYLKLTETCGKHEDTSKFHSNILMLKLKYLF